MALDENIEAREGIIKKKRYLRRR